MFNLNESILNWRISLNNNDSFTSENISELDNHLNEQIINLKESGLNDEEAFWIAQKRIGSIDKLQTEFKKVNSLNIFRKRIFWMMNGLICLLIYVFFVSSVSNIFSYISVYYNIDLMKATYTEYIINEVVFIMIVCGLIWGITNNKNNRLIKLKSQFINNLFVLGKGLNFFYFVLFSVVLLFTVSYYFRVDLNSYIIKSESYKEYKIFMNYIPMVLMIYHFLVMLLVFHISFKVNRKLETV